MPKIIQWMVRILFLHAITSNVGNYDWQMQKKMSHFSLQKSKHKKFAIGK